MKKVIQKNEAEHLGSEIEPVEKLKNNLLLLSEKLDEFQNVVFEQYVVGEEKIDTFKNKDEAIVVDTSRRRK